MRQAKDRGVQLGPWHWHKVVLNEGELDGVLGQAVLQHVHVASLEEPAQEVDRACWREDFFHQARNMAATPTSCSLDLVTERPSTARNRSTIEMVLNRVSCNT